jgi:hypothetical protein
MDIFLGWVMSPAWNSIQHIQDILMYPWLSFYILSYPDDNTPRWRACQPGAGWIWQLKFAQPSQQGRKLATQKLETVRSCAPPSSERSGFMIVAPTRCKRFAPFWRVLGSLWITVHQQSNSGPAKSEFEHWSSLFLPLWRLPFSSALAHMTDLLHPCHPRTRWPSPAGPVGRPTTLRSRPESRGHVAGGAPVTPAASLHQQDGVYIRQHTATFEIVIYIQYIKLDTDYICYIKAQNKKVTYGLYINFIWFIQITYRIWW